MRKPKPPLESVDGGGLVRFSVIVPAHNSEAYIRRCMNSIRCQSFTDYELIVVCDACTDGTEAVAREYADKVLFTNAGNDGPPRQAGVDAAEGDWILFLDDDDWWVDTEVLKKIDAAITNDIDVLLFGFVFKGVGYGSPNRFHNGARVVWPAVWNKCYRRDFILDVKFRSIFPTPDGQAADIDWTQRVLNDDPRIGVLDEPLYFYEYMRPGSQTMTRVKVGGDTD